MEKLELQQQWGKYGARVEPPDNGDLMNKINEIVEWINSVKDQLLEK